jgi:hypothetical protein
MTSHIDFSLQSYSGPVVVANENEIVDSRCPFCGAALSTGGAAQ